MDLVIQIPSLSAAMKFANEKKDAYGSAILNDVDNWTDNYGYEEFHNDFFSLRNKNPINKKVIESIKGMLSQEIEKHPSHFISSNTFVEENDVAGSVVDIGAYLEGSPECMINFRCPELKKTVNIFYAFGDSAGNTEEIKRMGRVIYCLDTLLKNKSVNLYGTMNISGKLLICLPIFLANQERIGPQVELVLNSPCAFFRRAVFAVMESAPDWLRDDLGIRHGRGYGSPRALSKEILKEHIGIMPDILITHQDVGNTDEEFCKTIIDLLTKEEKSNER